jgi:hypothetical protein
MCLFGSCISNDDRFVQDVMNYNDFAVDSLQGISIHYRSNNFNRNSYIYFVRFSNQDCSRCVVEVSKVTNKVIEIDSFGNRFNCSRKLPYSDILRHTNNFLNIRVTSIHTKPNLGICLSPFPSSEYIAIKSDSSQILVHKYSNCKFIRKSWYICRIIDHIYE